MKRYTRVGMVEILANVLVLRFDSWYGDTNSAI